MVHTYVHNINSIMSDNKDSVNSDNESNASWRSDRTYDAVIPKQGNDLAERWLKLFESGNWSDCSFQVGQPQVNQQKFECHALVLASCSPVFEAMLLGPMAEKKFPILIPDVSPDTFSILVKFAYTSKVENCSFTQALQVCSAADKYQIEGVLDECVDLLCEGLNPENVNSAFHLADQHNIKKLKDYCIRVMQDNTAQILSSPSFKECSADLVLFLLQQDQLCANEQQLTNAVMNWAINFLEEETTEDDSEKPIKETKESEASMSSEPKPCSSQEMTSTVDIGTGGHNLRKRSKKPAGNVKVKVQKKRQAPSSYTEKEKNRGLQLRTILGSVLNHMRFLSPSLNFSDFLEKFPCVLLEKEVTAILRTRQAYQKASKKIEYGPWESETKYEKLPQTSKVLETLIQKQNNKPLPNSLYNKFNERYAPFRSDYIDNDGKKVNFKCSPLTLNNRVRHNSTRFWGAYEIYPSRTIICYGIQLPSQISPDSYSTSTSMYRESIYIDAKYTDGCLSSGMLDYNHHDQGRILYNELVPYNSTITIMFPKPFEIDTRMGALLEISYETTGNYPCEETQKLVNTGDISIKISDAYKYQPTYCIIRGLIFESRSKDNKKLVDAWEGFPVPNFDDQSLESLSGVDDDWTSSDAESTEYYDSDNSFFFD